MTDKEKNKGAEPKAALGEYARELPDGLHGRVMAAVRADKTRRGEYRRLRITAVMAAAMLCIFAVSSAFLVMPFLKGNTPGVNEPIVTGACGASEKLEGAVGTSGGEQSGVTDQNIQPPVPVITDSDFEAVESVLPTSNPDATYPDADVASTPSYSVQEPAKNDNTDAALVPTSACDAKPADGKNDGSQCNSNASTGNAALAATVVISGISSVAAIILTLVQRSKLKSREKRKGRKND